MIPILRRALGLIRPDLRRRVLLVVPAAFLLSMVELAGFILLASTVQVLVDADALQDPAGVVGLLNRAFDVHEQSSFIAIVGSLAAVMLLVRGALASVLIYWQTGVIARCEATLATDLFGAYMQASYVHQLGRHSADQTRAIQMSTRNVTQRVLLPGVIVVTEAIFVLVVAALLVALQPVPALSAAATMLAIVVVYVRVVRRRATLWGKREEDSTRQELRTVQEGLFTFKTLAVLGRRASVVERYGQLRDANSVNSQRSMFIQQFTRYYLELGLIVLLVVVVWVSLRSAEGEAAIASLGVLLAGSLRMLPSAQRILYGVSALHGGAESVSIVERELESARAAEEALPGATQPVRFEHSIEFASVTLQYPGATSPALAQVSLTIPRGASVGVVGESGSGKSTLVDVLAGLLPVTSGELLIDGAALEGEHLGGWRRCLGYVPQQTTLIDDTLERNVALGLAPGELDRARVLESLAMAQLDELVADLPDGLSTSLGDRGLRLSGGQQQRVGIARALYHRPEILIFDEATSALDVRTERELTTTMEALYGLVTVIVVSHRLSTVRGCDKFVLLSHGTAAEHQSFESLVNALALTEPRSGW